MKKKLLVMLIAACVLAGCGSGNASKEDDLGIEVQKISSEAGSQSDAKDAASALTAEQAKAAIEKYCYASNPDLQGIVDAGEYPVYWEVESENENEIVILYRSYTGAQVRYYVNPATGETYVTEFVPGVMEEEEKSAETLNARDYLK